MAMAKLKYLTVEEVKAIADPILERLLGIYQFVGSRIEEVEDFDGSLVFRLTARVGKSVPAKTLVDVNQEIHSALRRQGEDRFVLLGTELPKPEGEEADEDIE